MAARVSTPVLSGDPFNLYFGVFWIVSVIAHLALLAVMTIATAGGASANTEPDINKPIIFDLADLPKGPGVGPVAPKQAQKAKVNPFQGAAKKIKKKLKESDMPKNRKKVVKSKTKERAHKPQQAVSAKDVLRNSAVERLKQKMAQTGEVGGGGTGKEDGGSVASIYVARVRSKIRSQWRKPSAISEADLSRSGWVRISIDDAGNLISVSIMKSSGNTKIDSSLLTAIRAASPFTRPPLELVDRAKSGIQIPFRGSEAK